MWRFHVISICAAAVTCIADLRSVDNESRTIDVLLSLAKFIFYGYLITSSAVRGNGRVGSGRIG